MNCSTRAKSRCCSTGRLGNRLGGTGSQPGSAHPSNIRMWVRRMAPKDPTVLHLNKRKRAKNCDMPKRFVPKQGRGTVFERFPFDIRYSVFDIRDSNSGLESRISNAEFRISIGLQIANCPLGSVDRPLNAQYPIATAQLSSWELTPSTAINVHGLG